MVHVNTSLQHTLAQKWVILNQAHWSQAQQKIVYNLHVKIFKGNIPLQNISPMSTQKIGWRKNPVEEQEDVPYML